MSGPQLEAVATDVEAEAALYARKLRIGLSAGNSGRSAVGKGHGFRAFLSGETLTRTGDTTISVVGPTGLLPLVFRRGPCTEPRLTRH
jgi:hypothetical protein